ncbi:MAG: CoA pyrophosphatase [Gammaproteobacteria bacterium]|nr:CoA pyrophosphatase [Gammaproteobacteria bacterium]NNC96848.1 CoA pyrophosphatase [Gammaproteobacteria bacterium]NNM13244.1 CoA pyrophosphatase [Gammaproteobacteria bacterium]
MAEPGQNIVDFHSWPDFGERIQHFACELDRMRSASVLIPIMTSGKEPYVLLTERSRHMTNHPGQISFPGGARDGLETILDTALREAEEEIGLPRAQVRPLGYLAQYPTITNFRVNPVVAEVIGNFEPKLQTEEVVSLIRVPLAYLMDKQNHHLKEIQFRGDTVKIIEINYQGNRIWGATAGIILHLYETLFLDN